MKKKFLSLALALCMLTTFMPYVQAATESDVVMVRPGYTTCAVKSDGSLWTWGGVYGHYIGNGTEDSSESPIKIMDGVKEVYEGYSQYFVIKKDNTLWGWGYNRGMLGDGTRNERLSPVKFSDDVEKMYFGSATETYILKTDNTLWGWGYNIGDGTTEQKISPTKISDNVKDVFVCNSMTYIIKTDNTLWGWGEHQSVDYEHYTGVGDGTENTRLSPVKILDNVRSISIAQDVYRVKGSNYNYMWAEPYSIFAVKNDNTLWAWGGNNSGQLIDGTTDYKLSPVKVMDNVKNTICAQMSDGYNSYASQWYVIKTDNSLWGWGTNYEGCLGIGNTEEDNIQTPIKIMDEVNDVISRSGQVNFAKKTDGTLWCWGRNTNYALGTGSKDAVITTPTKILDNVTFFKSDFVGYYGGGISYAIKSDKSLWWWGKSDFDSNVGSNVPTKLADNVSKVATDNNIFEMNFFIKNDGTLWGWGTNDGLLGDGTTTARVTPVQIFFNDSSSVTTPTPTATPIPTPRPTATPEPAPTLEPLDGYSLTIDKATIVNDTPGIYEVNLDFSNKIPSFGYVQVIAAAYNDGMLLDYNQRLIFDDDDSLQLSVFTDYEAFADCIKIFVWKDFTSSDLRPLCEPVTIYEKDFATE